MDEYNLHNFTDGQVLHATPLNEMDEQILQNKTNLIAKANDNEVVKITPQTLTDAQKAQARANIGVTGGGSGNVDDVQINGTSIIDDGVANIPIAGDTRLGVAKFQSSYGLVALADGNIRTSPATTANLQAHSHNYRPITPSNFDEMLKYAMCDGRGAQWTDAEKANARARIGVGGTYELIEEITLEENAPTFERSNEPNGTPYKFDGVFVSVSNASMPYSGTLTFATYNNNALLCWEFLEVQAGNSRLFSKVYNDRGLTSIENFCGLSGNNGRVYRRLSLFNNGLFLPITKIKFQDFTLPAGTNIKIYGLRA